MITANHILVLLSRSVGNVEAMTLALHQSGELFGKDQKEAKYYASWIGKGNTLSGRFIPKATSLCTKYATLLANLANLANRSLSPSIVTPPPVVVTPKPFPRPFCLPSAGDICRQAKVNAEGATALLANIETPEERMFLDSFKLLAL